MAVDLSSDTEYRDVIVTKVDAEERGWGITCDDGWSFYVPPEPKVEPHVGDVARFYGKGIGSVIRGLFLNGVEVFYRTPAEQEAENQRMIERHNAERRAAFAENRAKLDADYAALPPEFQARLDRFRASGPDWRWQHEGYEMSCCVDAVKIAAACGSPEAIKEFHDLPYDQQKERVPDLFEGHSGNSFGMACRLARIYLERPALVKWDHGALCNLMGCEEYGDLPRPTEEELAAL